MISTGIIFSDGEERDKGAMIKGISLSVTIPGNTSNSHYIHPGFRNRE